MITPVNGILNNPALAAQATDLAGFAPLPDTTHRIGSVNASDTHNKTDLGWSEKPRTETHEITNLDKALEGLNQSMQAWSTGIRFNIDEEAQRLVVSIVDNSTGEVLRTVPSDAVIQIAKMIVQLQGNAVNIQA